MILAMDFRSRGGSGGEVGWRAVTEVFHHRAVWGLRMSPIGRIALAVGSFPRNMDVVFDGERTRWNPNRLSVGLQSCQFTAAVVPAVCGMVISADDGADGIVQNIAAVIVACYRVVKCFGPSA